MTSTPEQEPTGGQAAVTRRKRLLAALGAVALIAVVVLVWVLVGRDDADADRAAGSTSGSTASSSSSGAPATGSSESPPATGEATPTAGSAGPADQPPPALPQVGLEETAAVGNGVSVALASIESIQATGTGPGNVAGPALRVTVRILNGTGAELGLDAVTVNAGYGEAVAPASPVDDPSRAPFGGTLAAGASAEGSYVFAVPTDARDRFVVEVGYAPGSPLVVFVGPVA